MILGTIILSLALLFIERRCLSLSPEQRAVCDRIKNGFYTDTVDLGPVISRSFCQTIIAEAESYAKGHGGWEVDRHEDYPTTDIEATTIPSLVYPIHNIVYRRIVPSMARAFHLDPTFLGIGEIFIAKYSASIQNHQRHLKAHTDGSDFSFVVALNDDFEGGGTRFIKSNIVERPPPGTAIAFCGKTRHEGIAVTKGTRYILAGFMKYGSSRGCDSDSGSGSDSDSDDE